MDTLVGAAANVIWSATVQLRIALHGATIIYMQARRCFMRLSRQNKKSRESAPAVEEEKSTQTETIFTATVPSWSIPRRMRTSHNVPAGKQRPNPSVNEQTATTPLVLVFGWLLLLLLQLFVD